VNKLQLGVVKGKAKDQSLTFPKNKNQKGNWKKNGGGFKRAAATRKITNQKTENHAV